MRYKVELDSISAEYTYALHEETGIEPNQIFNFAIALLVQVDLLITQAGGCEVASEAPDRCDMATRDGIVLRLRPLGKTDSARDIAASGWLQLVASSEVYRHRRLRIVEDVSPDQD